MKRKKTSIFIDLFFMLLGLMLVIIKLNDGLHSGRDWFSLVVGSIVMITSFFQLTQVNKNKD